MRKTTFDDQYFTDLEGSQAMPGRPSGKGWSKRTEGVRKCSVLWLGSSNSFKLLFLLNKDIREVFEADIYCSAV